jgi:ankyrin
LVSAVLAQRVDLHKVESLLRQGANTEKVIDRYGNTVLLKAIENKQKSVVELLIRYHVDVNKVNFNKLSPILKAVSLADEEMVALLLQTRANPNTMTMGGLNALHLSISIKASHITKMLLRDAYPVKADPNLVRKDGHTPLTLAAEFGVMEAVQYLLEYGADPQLKGKDNLTPVETLERYKPQRFEQILAILRPFRR